MSKRAQSIEDVITQVKGADAPRAWMALDRTPAQERIDDLQNKLAIVICNAEVMLEMVDGDARARLEALLRSAWTASRLAAETPLSSAPASPHPN